MSSIISLYSKLLSFVSKHGWLIGWLVTGAPTFVIWHHSLIQSRDLAPLINTVLVLVSSAKMKTFHGIANKVN